jgi:hypothetical protein
MRRNCLILLVTLPLLPLIFSCHKDHSGSGLSSPGGTPPVLNTVAISSITDSGAICEGNFTVDGTLSITTRGIEWDTNASFPNHLLLTAGGGIGDYKGTLTGLVANTRYYARAFAGTDTSTYFGNVLSFTTTYTAGKFLVTTIAGTGAAGFDNGDTAHATFYLPQGAATDQAGNIYIADFKNHAIRKITPGGEVSTFVTLGGVPNDIVTDSAGNIYVAEVDYKILKITPAGQVSTFAGSGLQGHVDATGTAAKFYGPITIAIDAAGNLFVGDYDNFRKITPAGVVTTLQNYFPGAFCIAIAVDRQNNIFESSGYALVKVDSSGSETFLAGTGKPGFSNGTGTAAAFSFLNELRLDGGQNLIGSDAQNNRIRMITRDGVVSTLAGTGAVGAQDGNSAIATFNGPTGLAVDNAGNIIVPDYYNNKIRKISPL